MRDKKRFLANLLSGGIIAILTPALILAATYSVNRDGGPITELKQASSEVNPPAEVKIDNQKSNILKSDQPSSNSNVANTNLDLKIEREDDLEDKNDQSTSKDQQENRNEFNDLESASDE